LDSFEGLILHRARGKEKWSGRKEKREREERSIPLPVHPT
jgi:hypothetical protein